MRDNVTSHDDQTWRKLHWLESFGMELPPAHRALKAEIQRRDLRSSIREPHPEAMVFEVAAAEDCPVPD